MHEQKRIAVLIDSDNISHNYVKIIFDELEEYGVPTYKEYMEIGQRIMDGRKNY